MRKAYRVMATMPEMQYFIIAFDLFMTEVNIGPNHRRFGAFQMEGKSGR